MWVLSMCIVWWSLLFFSFYVKYTKEQTLILFASMDSQWNHEKSVVTPSPHPLLSPVSLWYCCVFCCCTNWLYQRRYSHILWLKPLNPRHFEIAIEVHDEAHMLLHRQISGSIHITSVIAVPVNDLWLKKMKSTFSHHIRKFLQFPIG